MTTTPPIGPWHIAQYLRSTPLGHTSPSKSPPADRSEPVVRALVAHRVRGPVDFTAVPPAGAGLPFYRHPADRNAAATSISASRHLDVEA